MNALLVILLLAAPVEEPADVDEDDAIAASEDEDEARPEEEATSEPVVEQIEGPAKPLGELRRDALAHKRFAFCHEERTLVIADTIEFCRVLAKEGASDCPAWEKICKRLADQKTEDPASWSVPSWLRWLTLVGLVAALIALISRFLPERFFTRSNDDAEPVQDDTSMQELTDREHAHVETDVSRLLALAESAAARGAFLEAIDHAYAALLRRLEWNHVITVTKDSTNGDYLRDVSANAPDLRAPFRRIAKELEHAHFAGEGADRDRFTRVSSWVREALQQVTVAVVALAILTLSACYGPGPKETWPVGHGAFIDVLRAYGFDVHERLAPIESFDDIVTLLVLPGTHLSEEQWKTLKERSDDSRTCVVAMGGSYDWPDWFHAELRPAHTDGVLRAAEDGIGKKGMRLRVPIQYAIKPTDNDFRTYIHDDSSLYMVQHTTGCLLLLGDDALFTNVAMLDDSNLYVATELLRRLGKRIDIASELTGLSASNPGEIMLRAKLLPVVLQLLALLLVLFFARGAQFGTPSEPASAARRALSEHAQAMGLLYAKAKASEHVASVLNAFRSRSWKRKS